MRTEDGKVVSLLFHEGLSGIYESIKKINKSGWICPCCDKWNPHKRWTKMKIYWIYLRAWIVFFGAWLFMGKRL